MVCWTHVLLLSTFIPLIHSAPSSQPVPIAKRDINVHFRRVDGGLIDYVPDTEEDEEGDGESEGDGDDDGSTGQDPAVMDPRDDFMNEIRHATQLAAVAVEALADPMITDHPAYQAIFGIQADRANAVQLLRSIDSLSSA
jgi:hypothetical protein